MAVPPPPSPPAPTTRPGAKPALRRALRAARSRFAEQAGGDAGAAIVRHLTPLIAGERVVGGYVAHRGEPDVLPALVDAAATALPQLDDHGVMRFVRWSPGDALAVGPAGIAQPVDAVEVVPALLLVPLLGFDRRGHRLGQGGGHYDRWLATHPGTRTIGVAWSVQEIDRVPDEPWDVPLDRIVTEAGAIAR